MLISYVFKKIANFISSSDPNLKYNLRMEVFTRSSFQVQLILHLGIITSLQKIKRVYQALTPRLTFSSFPHPDGKSWTMNIVKDI